MRLWTSDNCPGCEKGLDDTVSYLEMTKEDCNLVLVCLSKLSEVLWGPLHPRQSKDSNDGTIIAKENRIKKSAAAIDEHKSGQEMLECSCSAKNV